MKVVVLCGGPSTEAEVSRASARAVQAALTAAGHEADTLELTASVASELEKRPVDVVFPAIHGAQGEDGCVQGLLEILGLPYVGSGVRGSAIAADKISSKVFFQKAGLPLARDAIVSERDLPGSGDRDAFLRELLARLREEVGPSLVVKPAEGGSTIGISRVLAGASLEDFSRALDTALLLHERVLIEEYVSGREFTCGVLEDGHEVRALPVTLIESQASDWYDFSSKYKQGGSRHVCPAPLDTDLTSRVQQIACEAHRAVGARDLSRSDFIVSDAGRIVLLELNTLPGMTQTSLYPEAAQAAGMTFPELVDLLVNQAVRRGSGRKLQGEPLPGQ